MRRSVDASRVVATSARGNKGMAGMVGLYLNESKNIAVTVHAELQVPGLDVCDVEGRHDC